MATRLSKRSSDDEDDHKKYEDIIKNRFQVPSEHSDKGAEKILQNALHAKEEILTPEEKKDTVKCMDCHQMVPKKQFISNWWCPECAIKMARKRLEKQ